MVNMASGFGELQHTTMVMHKERALASISYCPWKKETLKSASLSCASTTCVIVVVKWYISGGQFQIWTKKTLQV